MNSENFRQPIFNKDGSFREWHYLKLGEWFAGYAYKNDHPIIAFRGTGLEGGCEREMYEGDNIEARFGQPYDCGDFKAKVVFDEKHACFGLEKETPLYPGHILPFSDINEIETLFLPYIKIVGNQYEPIK